MTAASDGTRSRCCSQSLWHISVTERQMVVHQPYCFFWGGGWFARVHNTANILWEHVCFLFLSLALSFHEPLPWQSRLNELPPDLILCPFPTGHTQAWFDSSQCSLSNTEIILNTFPSKFWRVSCSTRRSRTTISKLFLTFAFHLRRDRSKQHVNKYWCFDIDAAFVYATSLKCTPD
jgi:hypothetical protein